MKIRPQIAVEKLIILGEDFNAPDKNWDTVTVTPGSPQTSLHQELININDSSRTPMHTDNVLDLDIKNITPHY